MSGKLRFKFGCMGSAKTAQLLTTAYNFDEKNIPCYVFKPMADTRDGLDVIKSRIGLSRECFSIPKHFSFITWWESMEKFDYTPPQKDTWILVDEAQFLTDAQVKELGYLADNYNLEIICYGLRTDYKGELFEGSKVLMCLADSIEHIKSRCECGRTTVINARFDGDNIVTDGEQVVIGGNESYKPLCRKCYEREVYNKKDQKFLDETSS